MSEATASIPNIPREISVFLELAKAFSGQRDLFKLLTSIKDEASRLMEADRASIFLVDKETNELWTLMADGVNVIRFPLGKGIVGSVIAQDEILNIPDASRDPRFYKEIDKQTGYQTRNILCVPMRNRFGRAVGAIEVLNKKAGQFTNYDESLLMILGTQAAVAIENVEMLEDVQETLHQLNLLNRIQRQANAILDIDAVLSMILREITSNLQAKYGIIMRLLPGGGGIGSFFAAPDRFAAFYAGDRQWGEWACSFPDVADSFDAIGPHMARLGQEEIFATRTGIVAAMKENDAVVGYIEIRGLQTDERLFNRRAVEFLKVVAGQTVSFVANRRLTEEKAGAEKMAVVGNMVSTIVHDIKNPLSGISGYAQLIRRKSGDERIHGYVDIMLDELSRLEEMNNELLLFVRGDRITFEFHDVSSAVFLAEIKGLLAPDFEQNRIGLGIEEEFKGNLRIDPNRMKRVFLNIANNARDAMPEGGSFRIRCKNLGQGKYAQFELCDSGTGMSALVKARIFEPFFTSGKKSGTGLGMAIAKTIIEKHNGSIRVESEQGKGTTFFIVLPTN